MINNIQCIYIYIYLYIYIFIYILYIEIPLKILKIRNITVSKKCLVEFLYHI